MFQTGVFGAFLNFPSILVAPVPTSLERVADIKHINLLYIDIFFLLCFQSSVLQNGLARYCILLVFFVLFFLSGL